LLETQAYRWFSIFKDKLPWKMKNAVDSLPQAEWIKMLEGFKS
jgi:hypothetical protein